ncbi:hypothetical protein [Lysobacter enzymogenes]|uniref:hypothetical protein n=1 Tax=Lysobacter enzymogenes TaxID=69 RepID=UPI001113432F|nr:hypothetical protein [Lysobacter enzymogenes]
MDEATLKMLGEVVTSLVTWMLVMIGWLVISERQVQMEIAKNNYSKFSKLRESVSKIEVAAIAYHTGEYDARAGRNIMRSLSTLGLEVSQLNRAKLVGMSAGDYVFKFKKAITFSNFDPGEFALHDASSELIQGVEEAADDLDRFLLESAEVVIKQPEYTIASLLKGIVRRIY